MNVKKKNRVSAAWLIAVLVAVVLGGVIFVGAVSGWFSDKGVVLDAEYYGESEMMGLRREEYDGLVEAKKSFVILVDQEGCTTADRLEGYAMNWAREKGVKVYKMMFADVKETSLHDVVKYYPSFVVVSRGKPVAWLRADADEDADAYNDEEVFYEWVGKFVKKK